MGNPKWIRRVGRGGPQSLKMEQILQSDPASQDIPTRKKRAEIIPIRSQKSLSSSEVHLATEISKNNGRVNIYRSGPTIETSLREPVEEIQKMMLEESTLRKMTPGIPNLSKKKQKIGLLEKIPMRKSGWIESYQ